MHSIIYEQPLNERVRNMLRLEHLFTLIDKQFSERTDWHCRFILEALLDIVDLVYRSDFKAELIKELKKNITMLSSLSNNPSVDQIRLSSLCEQLAELSNKLNSSSYQPGSKLKQDELVMSFKQRISIPGGTCVFDLPRFHFWLNQSDEIHKKDIESWQDDLQPIRNALKANLDLIRNSANASCEIAKDGFFQKSIEANASCQLIRVTLPNYSSYFPEISGGKHRFNIRFLESDSSQTRPRQTDNNVEFELHCCIL